MASSAAAMTVAYGAGATVGDGALLLVETANQAVPALTGWTVKFTSTGFGTAGSAGASRLTVLLKDTALTSAEITAGVSLGDSGDHQNAVLITYSGADGTTPIVWSGNSESSTATTSPATGSISVAVGDLCWGVVATDRDSATASTNSAVNWANLTGSNSFILNASSATGAGGGLIINEIAPTAVAGSTAFSCTITSSAWTAIVIVLKAAVVTQKPRGYAVIIG